LIIDRGIAVAKSVFAWLRPSGKPGKGIKVSWKVCTIQFSRCSKIEMMPPNIVSLNNQITSAVDERFNIELGTEYRQSRTKHERNNCQSRNRVFHSSFSRCRGMIAASLCCSTTGEYDDRISSYWFIVFLKARKATHSLGIPDTVLRPIVAAQPVPRPRSPAG